MDDLGTTTASSDCFSGMVNLDNGNLETKFSRGSTSLLEACSAISYDHLRNTAPHRRIASLDFGVVSLPKLQWKDRSVFGTESAPEACSAITLANYLERTEVMIVGSTEAGGLLTGLSTSGRSVQQYGIILDLSNQGGNYVLLGGTAADESEVQFPIQVLTSGHQIFMVSMSSRDAAVRPHVGKYDMKYPDLTTRGIEKYGSEYNIVVERHTINR